MVSSRSHTKTLWRGEEWKSETFTYLVFLNDWLLMFSLSLTIMLFWGFSEMSGRQSLGIRLRFEWNIWLEGVFQSLTSRSLSGGGEGLFLRPLPRDLEPPLRQARSSISLMGVEGLCTVSKSPESARNHGRQLKAVNIWDVRMIHCQSHSDAVLWDGPAGALEFSPGEAVGQSLCSNKPFCQG